MLILHLQKLGKDFQTLYMYKHDAEVSSDHRSSLDT